MATSEGRFDPYLHDPERWGVSLAQVSELILPCLDAIGARSVAEIGAFSGDLTRVLVDWAAGSGARVLAIDPAPQEPLRLLATTSPQLELIEQPSLRALPGVPLADAVIVDGDHNYFTVREELCLLGERAPGAELPLLLFHDVCWPHGRRDDYFSADAIPAADRQPLVGDGLGISPGDPGASAGGMPYPRSAAREGGPGNGVLTAIEDFVAGREGLRLAIVPVFFGLGAVWPVDAPWARDVARILDPWDRNPVLARLEANRVDHLAREHRHLVELWSARASRSRRDALLRRLLDSSAFGLAERLSRLRVRAGVASAEPAIGKDEIRQVLED